MMLDVKKFAILKLKMGHTFGLKNYSNEDDNITKSYEPKLQVQYMEKNEYIPGMDLANNGLDT